MADKATDTPQAIETAGHTDWERAVLSDNSLAGTLRVLVYIAAFVVVFGSIFAALG